MGCIMDSVRVEIYAEQDGKFMELVDMYCSGYLVVSEEVEA